MDPQKRRQRVSVACLVCRKKRMRCDGVEPECTPCKSRGTQCVYQHGENKRKPPSKRYVESLEARVKFLEAELANAGQPVETSFKFKTEDGALDALDNYAADDPDERDPLAEVTGLIGRLNVGDDGELHYFGSQSSLHLLRTQLGDPAPKSSLYMQDRGMTVMKQLGMGREIPMELQEHLLDLYWKWQNPWYYVVHKESFLRDFRQRGHGRYCSALLLSAIFSLASRYSDRPELRSDPDDPNTAGQSFVEQCKILFLYETEAPTITTVQAACLMALRTMSDNKDALGWLYCGNATRMAMDLGLNLDCSNEVAAGLIKEEEAEVRRVTWWSCHNIDKFFTIALGRPGCTRKCQTTCPYPSMHKDEYDPWVSGLDMEQPLAVAHAHIPSTSRYISESLTIASEAMDKIYAPNYIQSRRDLEHIITKADVELRSFHNNMPSYLRLPPAPRTPTLPHVYLLHIQHHVHLVLLHRPLMRTRRPGSGVSPPDTAPNSHRETCRHSAAEIAKLLRTYKLHYTLRTIPIVAVHNAFTAAVIHLIDALPGCQPQLRAQALRYLRICIDSLQEMSSTWCSWSMRALRSIRRLAQEWKLDAAELGTSDVSSSGTDSLDGVEAAAAQINAVPEMVGAPIPPLEGQELINGGSTANGADFLDFSALPDPPQDDGLGHVFLLSDGLDPFVKDWLDGGGVDFFNL